MKNSVDLPALELGPEQPPAVGTSSYTLRTVSLEAPAGLASALPEGGEGVRCFAGWLSTWQCALGTVETRVMISGLRAQRLPLSRVALVLALACTGCGLLKSSPPASDVRAAPDFTAANLQAGGLGVLGVVGITSEDGDSAEVLADRAEAAARLWKRLHSAREGWRVWKEEEMTAALGRPDHDSLLAAYSRTPPAGGEELARYVASLQDGPRYLLFCMVDRDAVMRTETGFFTSENPVSDSDCPGPLKPNTSYTVYKTSRYTAVTFDVYDCVARDFAWHGSIEETNRQAHCEKSAGLLEAIVTTALDLEPYPIPPERIDALDAVFRKLARALPKD